VAAGQLLGAVSPADPTPLIAVSVPSRAYFAVLAAIGIVGERVRSSPPEASADLEAWVRSLDVGTPLRFRERGAVRTGILKGLENAHGSLCALVESTTKTQYLVPPAMWEYMEVLETSDAVKGAVRRVGVEERIVKAAFGVLPKSFGTRTSRDCVMVGIKDDLLEDCRLELSVVGAQGKIAIRDVIRPRQVVGQRQAHRSEILATASDVKPSTHAGDVPVILDGSRSIVRWAAKFATHPILAILDRTDAAANDAGLVIAELSGRGRPAALGKLPEVPGGMEVVTYLRGAGA
jgi:hypothetical protein